MPVTKLQFRPGLVRDTTSYANEGGWFYSDKIRFRSGSPEKIGGWTRLNTTAFAGTCNALMSWASLGGVPYISAGTNVKYYIAYASDMNDITPVRSTTAAGDVTFAATNGSASITVTDAAHGALVGDYVIFSGAVSLGGNITAAVLNAEYQVTSVVSANSYTFTASATASAGDVGNGGAAVVGTYLINTGLATYAIPGLGWGAGGWDTIPWGGTGTSTPGQVLRLWSQSSFGEDLIFSPRDGALYYWDLSVGLATRAVAITSMAGASDVPVVAKCIFVTDSRHVVALGCNPYESPPNLSQDPMLVRWSDTEDAVNWTPTVSNTAGGQRLTVGSQIMCARNSRLESLIWTDTALYAMTYVGGSLEFGFNLLGSPTSLIGPNAVAIVGGTAYWMGIDKFYIYNGSVDTLPCPLMKLLLDNVNHSQAYLVTSGTNEHFGEVTWFYPSTNSSVVDSYITYNYVENIWYFGTMNRSAWIDSSIFSTPIAADNVNNVLQYHDFGADDATNPATPVGITAFIESSDFDLGDGQQFMFISRVIPDVDFSGSTQPNPAVTMTVKTRNTPGDNWSETSPGAVTQVVGGGVFTSPLSQATPQLWCRLRGRQGALRVESSDLGVKWQLGAVRLDIRPDGRRS